MCHDAPFKRGLGSLRAGDWGLGGEGGRLLTLDRPARRQGRARLPLGTACLRVRLCSSGAGAVGTRDHLLTRAALFKTSGTEAGRYSDRLLAGAALLKTA